jgi:hypothetical protein
MNQILEIMTDDTIVYEEKLLMMGRYAKHLENIQDEMLECGFNYSQMQSALRSAKEEGFKFAAQSVGEIYTVRFSKFSGDDIELETYFAKDADFMKAVCVAWTSFTCKALLEMIRKRTETENWSDVITDVFADE